MFRRQNELVGKFKMAVGDMFRKTKGKPLPRKGRFPEERHTQTHGNLFDIF